MATTKQLAKAKQLNKYNKKLKTICSLITKGWAKEIVDSHSALGTLTSNIVFKLSRKKALIKEIISTC